MSDPIATCAQIVHDSDNERFLDIMAMPLAFRPQVFACYALHYEIAKIPYVTKEPMLAMMRMQWWRDALESTQGGVTENHPIIIALAHDMNAHTLAQCDRMMTARHWDIEQDHFDSFDAQAQYISDSFGALYNLIGQITNLDPTTCERYGNIIGLWRLLHSAQNMKNANETFALAPQDVNPAIADALQQIAQLGQSLGPLANDHRRVARDLRYVQAHGIQIPIPEKPLHNKWLRLIANFV